MLATLRNHPRGLSTLFFTEFWERFSYYGMRALLIVFLVTPITAGGFGYDKEHAASIYGWYTSLVYATAIPGGIIADRWLGLRRSVLVGGILIALGHFSLAFVNPAFFFTGLGLIVCGTGLLKPNISSMVGGLYEADDVRRDSGFSIFYVGINLGAFVAPLICGYLGQKKNWHYGFAAAGVGMVLGLIQYVWGAKHLKKVGLSPTERKKEKKSTPAAAFTPQEWKRMGAIAILFLFSTLFWGAYEQAGSSLNLFALERTKNTILGWNYASTQLQSVPAAFVILLGLVFAWFWIALGKRNPSSPAKFAYGLFFVGLGFLVMAYASLSGEKVSPMYLVVCYFFHTVGELCLSPVGLSIVTKLAPERVVGSMMGVWFLSLAFGNKLGGWIAGFFDQVPLQQLFGSVFVATTVAALTLALLIKPLKKLMGGVH